MLERQLNQIPIVLYHCIFSLIFVCSIATHDSHAESTLVIQMEGNAAQYGYVSVDGPENKNQSRSCPRTALGNIPVGISRCESSFGTRFQDLWQPFDVLTAVVPRSSSTDIPAAARDDASARCLWEFTGFRGACNGMGEYVPGRDVYMCSFILPQIGDVELRVGITGKKPQGISGGVPTGGGPCPIIDNPFGDPPPQGNPTAQPTTTPAPPAPDPELDDIADQIADDFIDRLRQRKLKKIRDRKIREKFGPIVEDIVIDISARIDDFSNSFVQIDSSSVATAKKKKKKKKKKKTSCPSVIGRGSFEGSMTEERTLNFRFTRGGKKCLKGRKDVNLVFSFEARSPLQASSLAPIERTLEIRGNVAQ